MEIFFAYLMPGIETAIPPVTMRADAPQSAPGRINYQKTL